MKALLIIAALVDFAIAVLMTAVSGFIYGPQEGMRGTPSVAIPWTVMLAACLLAPVVAYVVARRRSMGVAAIIAWAPPVIAGIVIALPPLPF